MAQKTKTSRKDRAEAMEKSMVDKLVELMEQADPADWHMPWHIQNQTVFGENNPLCPMNPESGTLYRGRNWMVLAMASMGLLSDEIPAYNSARFATFKQWQAAGVSVRKGEQALPIAYFGSAKKKDAKDDDDTYRFMRYYCVFAAEQVDGLEAPIEDFTPLSQIERDAAVERFVDAIGADVRHGGNKARHVQCANKHHIDMPDFERFETSESYYATLLHELVHWTKRLVKRDEWLVDQESDPDRRYALEELVAEIGSAMLCGVLKVSNEPRPDHAQYLKGWAKALTDDHTVIFKAATKAQQAVDYLCKKADFVPETVTKSDDALVVTRGAA